jgi:hypothetical protein
MACVINRTGDDAPESLAHNDVAKAYYGCITEILQRPGRNGTALNAIIAEASLASNRIIQERRIVNWTTNPDQQNRMRQDIEDYRLT